MSGQFPARSYQRSQMQVSELRLTRHVRTLFKSRFEIDRYGRRRERRFLRDEDDIFRAGFLHLALRGIPNRNVACRDSIAVREAGCRREPPTV